jgi:hypothetical protein
MFYVFPGLNNLTNLRNLHIASNHIEGFKSLHGTKDFWVTHYLFTVSLFLHQTLYNYFLQVVRMKCWKWAIWSILTWEVIALITVSYHPSRVFHLSRISVWKRTIWKEHSIWKVYKPIIAHTLFHFKKWVPRLCCDLISSIFLQPRIGSFEQLEEAVSQRKWDWRVCVLRTYYLNIPHERWWLHGSIDPPNFLPKIPCSKDDFDLLVRCETCFVSLLSCRY